MEKPQEVNYGFILMKQYEITYLTKEDLKEKPVAKEIESLGGKIINASSLGQKQLAYKIKKQKEAFFTNILFEIEGEKIIELNRKLGLKEEILRHLIVISKKTKEVLPKKPKEIKKPVESKPIKEEKKIEKATAKLPKPEKITATKKTTESEIDEKERLKELDKKLEELLKE